MLAKQYAHRGYHDKPAVPENSIPAFRRAIEHGWGVEFDVHLIADGSLVVFHDEKLLRQTGVSGYIEDYDLVNLAKLRLEGTDERIPTLDEVLDLFEQNPGPNGKPYPLLIELKVARNNYRELVRKICERLDRYSGDFVMESFDPRALMELRKVRPDFGRGQLVQDFVRFPEGVRLIQRIPLTYLMFDPPTKPDFIAFRMSDGLRPSVMKRLRKKGMEFATWTITTPEDYTKSIRSGHSPIFERFDPEQIKE